MVKIAIVQGRLSSQVGSRYQHFPIHAWRNEFKLAAKLGFDGIEWIVSDFSNPLFDDVAVAEVTNLTQKYGVNVTSVSLDILMYNPIFKLPWKDVEWLFDRLCVAVKHIGIRRVSIPIEENSGIHNPNDVEAAISTLRHLMKRYANCIPLLCLETDLSPKNAQKVLANSGLEHLGLLVDVGNITANGFSFDDFVTLCGSRIYGIHIKDRRVGCGPTMPLGEGDADLKSAFARTKELYNLADIVLQAFRSPDNFLEDAKNALLYVKTALEEGGLR